MPITSRSDHRLSSAGLHDALAIAGVGLETAVRNAGQTDAEPSSWPVPKMRTGQARANPLSRRRSQEITRTESVPD